MLNSKAFLPFYFLHFVMCMQKVFQGIFPVLVMKIKCGSLFVENLQIKLNVFNAITVKTEIT